MSDFNIIRAWKDRAFRRSLTEAERALLPENPAGAFELTEAEAAAVEGMAAVCDGSCICLCHTNLAR